MVEVQCLTGIQLKRAKLKNSFRVLEKMRSREEESGGVFTVHGVLAVGEELRQRPEGVLLIQVHEQDGGNLTHPLAIAHLLVHTPERKQVQTVTQGKKSLQYS